MRNVMGGKYLPEHNDKLKGIGNLFYKHLLLYWLKLSSHPDSNQ